jgi:hypothetical protein
MLGKSIHLFQLFHAFSHSFHINNKFQTITQHMLSYLINYSIGSFSGYLVVLDLIFMLQNKIILSIVTQAIILFTNIKSFDKTLFLYFLLIIMLMINEKYNCKRMQRFKKFPYHIFIEIVGLLFFRRLHGWYLLHQT